MPKITTTTVTTVKPDGSVATTTTTETVADAAAAPAPPAPTDFPDTPAEVTAEFLSGVIGKRVKKFEVSPLGLGFICDAHKVTITEYDGPAGPPSVVLKMPKEDDASRETNKGFFALEAHWYRTVAKEVPITSASAFGVFTDDANPKRFLLVLEDLMLDPDNEGYPNWMTGVTQDVMQQTIDDLAKMHGKFFNHPDLDKIVPDTPPLPGVPMKEGSYNAPFVGFAMFAYAPFPTAPLVGLPESATGIEVAREAMVQLKEYLEWDYTVDGVTHRMPDGPFPFPDPSYNPPLGAGIVLKVCELMGKKPRTLLHGDGHPGNLFRNKKTGAITWIDFQGYSKGPPGMDLAQGLGLGVLGASKEKLFELTKNYYAKLLEYGPPEIAEQYPFESCWEDVLLGMALWYPGYITVQALTLPMMKGDPNAETRRLGLKQIIPRYVGLIISLDFINTTVKDLVGQVMADAAAAAQ